MQINCTKKAHSNVIQRISILPEHFSVDYQFPIVLPRKTKKILFNFWYVHFHMFNSFSTVNFFVTRPTCHPISTWFLWAKVIDLWSQAWLVAAAATFLKEPFYKVLLRSKVLKWFFFLAQFFNINVKFDLLNRLVVYHKSIDRMSILSLHFHCSTALLSWSCIMHLILDWLTECDLLTYSVYSLMYRKAESNYCFLKSTPILATHLKCWLIFFRNRINERSSQFCLMDTTKYASYLLKLHCLEKYNHPSLQRLFNAKIIPAP